MATRAREGRGIRPTLLLWTAVTAPVAFVYWRTMAPGLLARGDSPKFQYVGAVLGIPHPPGYPLYVCLSWLFAHLPFHTIAWRINLMTMVFGVLAAGATSWAGWRLGAGRTSAGLAGLGLAFGPVFWAQATSAEVYTLAALFQAGAIGLVVAWHRTRRTVWLVAAVTVSALALGHHPTFAMIVPALAAFVLVTDWRVLTRWRLLAVLGGLVVLGLAQYGFVLLRTAQGAPYLEAHARTLSELIGVVRGQQFRNSLFAFSWTEIATTRVPLIARLVAAELSWPALALAAVGLVRLAASNWRAAMLLGTAALAVFAFACTYDVEDIAVFVIPVFVVMWMLAAVGLSWIASQVRRPAARVALAVGATAALAVLLVARWYAQEDLSGARDDPRYFEAMFDTIQTPALIFAGSHEYAFEHAARYEQLTRPGMADRVRVARIGDDPDPALNLRDSRGTYAFEEARSALEAEGVDMAAVVLEARLTDRLAERPPRAVIAIAATPQAAAGLNADDLAFLRLVGADRLPANAGFVAVATNGSLVRSESGSSPAVRWTMASGRRAEIAAEVTVTGAAIRVNGHPVVSGPAGLLAAAVDASGAVLWADTVARNRGVRPVLDMGRIGLYRAVGVAPCRTARSGDWARLDRDDLIGTRVSAWLRPDFDPGAQAGPPWLTGYVAASTEPPVPAGLPADAVERFDLRTDAGRARLADRLREDGVPLDALRIAAAGGSTAVPRFVLRAQETLGPIRWGTSTMWPLAVHPEVALLRFDSPVPAVGRMCADAVRGVVLFGDASETMVELVRSRTDALGAGWGESDGDGDRRRRLMSDDRASVRFTLRQPLALTVTVDAGGAGEARAPLTLEVNGEPFGPPTLAQPGSPAQWAVPAAAFESGFNELTIATNPDGERAPAAEAAVRVGVRALTLTRRTDS